MRWKNQEISKIQWTFNKYLTNKLSKSPQQTWPPAPSLSSSTSIRSALWTSQRLWLSQMLWSLLCFIRRAGSSLPVVSCRCAKRLGRAKENHPGGGFYLCRPSCEGQKLRLHQHHGYSSMAKFPKTIQKPFEHPAASGKKTLTRG